MKPKQSELIGQQQRATWHLLPGCLLPLLMGMVLAGCTHSGKVAAVAGEGQPAVNVSKQIRGCGATGQFVTVDMYV